MVKWGKIERFLRNMNSHLHSRRFIELQVLNFADKLLVNKFCCFNFCTSILGIGQIRFRECLNVFQLYPTVGVTLKAFSDKFFDMLLAIFFILLQYNYFERQSSGFQIRKACLIIFILSISVNQNVNFSFSDLFSSAA